MARVRSDSERRLLDALLAQGGVGATYDTLAEASNFSPRTVASLMSRLREKGFVRASPARLGPAWGYVLSVALGAESCRAGLVDANGALVVEYEAAPEPDQTKLAPSALLGRIVTAAREVLARAHRNPDLTIDGQLRLLGLATAWPCPVRGSKRAVGTILNPAWMTHQPATLPEAVAKATGFRSDQVHVLNDANAHALAVAFDQARRRGMDADDTASRIALLLRIGGGLGAATMILAPHKRGRLSFIDSTLLGGARSLAGELAHLPIDASLVEELNGRANWEDGLAPLSMDWRCSCGHRGHLEAFASGTAWVRRMEESGVQTPPLLEGMRRHSISQTDKALSDLEDQRITYALEDMGRLIGRSLASPILLLDPRSLYLTGSFAVKPVVDGIMAERETWRHVFGDALSIEAFRGSDPKFVGVRGAALAVIRSRVYRRFGEWLDRPDLARELLFSP